MNKLVDNGSLIYLGAKCFGKSKRYSVEWIVRRIKGENKSETVKILNI